MVRTQIQLTEEQADALKRLAVERGVSMAALVREAVTQLVADGSDLDARWERALRVRAYRDREGATDLSVNHDEYFVESIEARLRS